jgi:hypothetical protein
MAISNYTKAINSKQLAKEIKLNGSVGSLFTGKIIVSGTNVDIETTSILSGANQIILDGLVSAHIVNFNSKNKKQIHRDSSTLSESADSSSTVFKQKAKVETPSDENGDFNLCCYFEYKGSTPIIEIHIDGVRYTGIEEKKVGWDSFSCDIPIGEIIGTKVIELVYKTSNIVKPTEIRNASLALRRN